MFERFLECGVDKVMLEIQYRMHPSIREFPSTQYYDGRLMDDPSIEQRAKHMQESNSNLSLIQSLYQPIQFVDLTYSLESNSETSKVNNDEVAYIEHLLK